MFKKARAQKRDDLFDKYLSGGLPADASEEDKNRYHEEKKYMIIAFVIIVIVSAIYYAYTNSDIVIDSIAKLGGGNKSDDHFRDGVRRRKCLITEQQCSTSRSKNCLTSTGKVGGPSAITPDDLNICCRFSCEEYGIPIRTQCKSNEQTCPPGQSCLFGSTVKQINAFDEAGNGCCTFECNSGDGIANRQCNSSEVRCGLESECYGHSGELTTPSARNSSGVCCQYYGSEKNVCSIPSG